MLDDDYRMRGARRLLHLLEVCFPAVRQIVGLEQFEKLTFGFISSRGRPPPSVRSCLEQFPCFIQELEKVHGVPALCDVAILELQCACASWRLSAPSLSLVDLGHLQRQQLYSIQLDLHPTASIVCSQYPIVTLWAESVRGPRVLNCRTVCPEAALVVRPDAEVKVARLTLGSQSFLRALRTGLPLGDAAYYAQSRDADFQFLIAFLELVEWGTFARGYRQGDLVPEVHLSNERLTPIRTLQ